MDIVKACIRSVDGKYTLELSLSVAGIISLPLSVPLTSVQASILKLAGVPNCS